MPKRYTKQQLIIGRGIWAGICAYVAVSIIDWYLIGQPSAEWIITTLLAIVLGVLGFLAANEQVERAMDWMGRTWKWGVGMALAATVVVVALLLPFPYFQHVITLGADLPGKGLDKANGEAVERGIRLAIEQENAANKQDGGFSYTFNLRVLDDVPDEKSSANPGRGMRNIEKLMKDQHVAGIIGPYNTDVAIKQIPIVNTPNDRIALISPSTTAECLTGPKAKLQIRIQYDCDKGYLNGRDGNGAFFRIAASNNKMAEVYVGCLSADVAATPGSCPNLPHQYGQRYKQMAVIDDGSVFSVSLADSIAGEWNARSKTPVVYGPTSAAANRITASLSTKLDELVAVGTTPDLIVFVGSYQNSAAFQNLLEQYSSLNNADIAYSTSIMNLPVADHFLSKDTSNRSYYSVAPLISLKDSANPHAQKFVEAYKEKYQTDPNPYSATGYDAAKILVAAIKKAEQAQASVPTPNLLDRLLGRSSQVAKNFRDAVIENIRDGNEYESAASATGSYVFAPNSNGDVRDVKSTAVSVFRWNPSNADNSTNINGWDFQ